MNPYFISKIGTNYGESFFYDLKGAIENFFHFETFLDILDTPMRPMRFKTLGLKLLCGLFHYIGTFTLCFWFFLLLLRVIFTHQFYIKYSKMTKLLYRFAQTFAPESFIPKNKFKDTLYQVYESTEGRSIKAFNIFYMGYIGFNCYQYYRASLSTFNQAEKENSFILLCALGVGMIGFKMKTSRTLKNMWIDQNGRHSYLELYRMFGF